MGVTIHADCIRCGRCCHHAPDHPQLCSRCRTVTIQDVFEQCREDEPVKVSTPVVDSPGGYRTLAQVEPAAAVCTFCGRPPHDGYATTIFCTMGRQAEALLASTKKTQRFALFAVVLGSLNVIARIVLMALKYHWLGL